MAAKAIAEYRAKHEGETPLAALDNLMYNANPDQNQATRHTTIAINGIFSQDTEGEEAW